MSKKVLSWILAVATILSLLIAIPITANAQPPEYNCQIVETDVEYASLDGAISDVSSGQTIRLLTDITYGSAIMAYNKSFTLDVSGYSLTVSVLNQTGFYAGNGYDLHITDSVGGGAVALSVSSGTSLAGLYADGYGSEIDVDVPTSVNITGNSCYGVYALQGGVVSLTGNITVTGTGSYGAGAFSGVYGSLITIDGEIDSTNYINANGTVFTGPEQCVLPTTKAGYLTFMDTGDSANPQSTVWVKETTYVAEVDGVGYETLNEAIAAAAVDWDTIKLLADIDFSGSIVPDFDMYINLNGHTLNVVNESGAAIQVDGDYSIDISGQGALNATGTTYGVYVINGGSAEVTNASASADGGRAVFVDSNGPSSTVTVNGDATANGSGSTGVLASTSNCSVTISGDVTANGTDGAGVRALDGATVTVQGYIEATNYITLQSTVKAEGDYSSIANNYYVYTDGTNTVRARQEVCSLDGVNYLFLEDALADAGDGDTITLLADIRYEGEIVLTNKDLQFDLDTYKLNIGRTGSDGALKVDGGNLTIDDTDGGEFNIVDGYVGVRALNEGTATVTSISGLNGYGIVGESGGSVIVKEDISVLSYMGVGFNLNSGSSAHVLGNIYSLDGVYVGSSCTGTVDGNISATSGDGIEAYSGGTVTVKGDVTAGYRGVSAYGWTEGGGNVHVFGNVIGNNYYGVEASAASEVIIDGDVQSLKGLFAIQDGTTISVGGNTTSTGADEHGASAVLGGLITVNGFINASNYVLIGETTMTQEQGVFLGRYTVYTDGVSAVRTKGIEFFKEDFEHANMDGWSQSNIGWSVTNTLTLPTTTAHSGSWVAKFNSASLPDETQSLLYQTESLNLSNGTDYWLEFWMYHDSGWAGYNDYVTVQISTDGGSSWTNLGTEGSGTFYRYSDTPGWKKEALSLAAYAGEADVRIAFLGVCQWGYNIFIDDVSVSHECIIDGCSVTEAYGGFIASSEIEGETYYHVSTPEQLAHINDHRNLNFILTADIDLSGEQWIPIGKTYGTSFNGCFDGNGHSISGMTITEVSGADAYGLFGNLGIEGIIEDLTIESGSITFSEAVGNGYFGGIVGHSLGLVKNCVNKADITITNDDWTYAGGIVGLGNADINSYTWSARIYGCRNEGDIQIGRIGSVGGIIGNQVNSTAATYIDRCTNSGNVTGGYHAEAGGIAGRIDNAGNIGIVNCFNTGNITSGEIGTNQAYVGGIVGYEYYSQVKNCYNTGDVTLIYSSLGNTFCGGISGHADIAAENCYSIGTVTGTGSAGEGINGAGIGCTNCYYLDTSTPSNAISGVTSLTVMEMKSQSSFTNWDFTNTWTINSTDNDGYPALEWQGFENESPSNDATLSALTASGTTLNPTFDSSVTGYSASVANNIDSTTITATASDSNATVLINGIESTNREVDLTVGDNVVTVEVTAEDGIITKTYTITINRASAGSSGGGGTAVTYYTITASSGTGGSVSPSGNVSVKEDQSKTFTITPDSGYEIADVLVDGVSVGVVAEYTFSKITDNHSIEAMFEPTGGYFTDVDSSLWYREGIDFVILNGLFKGTSETTFEPNSNMTRAMLVTVLWRLENEPDATIEDLFADIATGTWYGEAVAWAAANDIVQGYDEDTFGPDDPVTREQMAAILYRYASYKGYNLTAAADLPAYTDAGDTSDWALTVMKWAIAEGLINGVSEKCLDPSGYATRAQVATILMRFMQNIVE